MHCQSHCWRHVLGMTKLPGVENSAELASAWRASTSSSVRMLYDLARQLRGPGARAVCVRSSVHDPGLDDLVSSVSERVLSQLRIRHPAASLLHHACTAHVQRHGDAGWLLLHLAAALLLRALTCVDDGACSPAEASWSLDSAAATCLAALDAAAVSVSWASAAHLYPVLRHVLTAKALAWPLHRDADLAALAILRAFVSAASAPRAAGPAFLRAFGVVAVPSAEPVIPRAGCVLLDIAVPLVCRHLLPVAAGAAVLFSCDVGAASLPLLDAMPSDVVLLASQRGIDASVCASAARHGILCLPRVSQRHIAALEAVTRAQILPHVPASAVPPRALGRVHQMCLERHCTSQAVTACAFPSTSATATATSPVVCVHGPGNAATLLVHAPDAVTLAERTASVSLAVRLLHSLLRDPRILPGAIEQSLAASVSAAAARDGSVRQRRLIGCVVVPTLHELRGCVGDNDDDASDRDASDDEDGGHAVRAGHVFAAYRDAVAVAFDLASMLVRTHGMLGDAVAESNLT